MYSKYLKYAPRPHPHILQLPDSFETWISGWYPHWNTQRSQIMAHCRRELIQAVWKYILDNDFIHTIYMESLLHAMMG